MRAALYALVERYGLDRPAAQRLFALAGLQAEPARLGVWFWRTVAVLAAAFGGLGTVLWIAAHWNTLGRAAQFGLLQALVSVAVLGALPRTAARAPLLLLALLGIGALFAFFGQTYQTGADPWQLFALWAALSLPLAMAARSDVLWAPWALVTATAISLWTQAHTGHQWRVEPQDLPVYAAAWAAQGLVIALLSRRLRRATGAGVWALRTAGTLAVVMVALTALGGLFHHHVAPHYGLGLLLLAAAAALAARRASFEIYLLSAVALALDGLLIAGMVRLGFSGADFVGTLLVIGLAAAALLAASVQAILRLARSGGYGAGPVRAAARVVRADEPVTPPDVPPLQRVVAAARQQGLLPSDADAAVAEDPHHRPWPVVLLTALGAWLAALPLLGVVALMLGPLLEAGVGPYLVGAVLIAGATAVLRGDSVPVFVEQLALPGLLVGAGGLGFGLFRDLPASFAALALGLLLLGLAFAIRRAWLRVLLGAAAALLAGAALVLRGAAFIDAFDGFVTPWLAAHLLLAAWVAALAAQRHRLCGAAQARLAMAVEAIAAGWLLATLALLAWLSGMTFLVAGALGTETPMGLAQELGPRADTLRAAGWQWHPLASALLAAAAAALAGRAWPTLRGARQALAALPLLVLAWFMPLLGAVLLALAITATTGRWRLAGVAALAAAWIVGAFYYHLGWPLATKASVLVGCALALGALAWSVRPGRGAAAAAHGARGLRTAPAALLGAVALAATLAVANVGIWRNERTIAQGATAFVELAPVDPRSLMQGDFMRLNFRIPPPDRHRTGEDGGEDVAESDQPFVVARRDERDVATLLRRDDGHAPLAPGELRIALVQRAGDWELGTDAWFFREGDGARWEPARYGEFKVMADGRALLVGMADAQLRRIEP